MSYPPLQPLEEIGVLERTGNELPKNSCLVLGKYKCRGTSFLFVTASMDLDTDTLEGPSLSPTTARKLHVT